jgi:hypothetical protein
MNIYPGAPAGARRYLAAARGGVDDYYLTEGAGIARRFAAGPEGSVAELAPLSGAAYEAWVAGVDPETSVPPGAAAHG